MDQLLTGLTMGYHEALLHWSGGNIITLQETKARLSIHVLRVKLDEVSSVEKHDRCTKLKISKNMHVIFEVQLRK